MADTMDLPLAPESPSLRRVAPSSRGAAMREEVKRDAARPLLVAGSLLAVYLIWSSTYLGIRIAIETLPPLFMAGARFTIAGALLYGVLRWRGAPRPTRAEWRGAAVTGALLLVGGNGLVAVAEQWVSSGLAAVVFATVPLWAALFARVFGERTSLVEWAGLALGFGGVALLHLGGGFHVGRPGALVILLAPACWALGSVASARVALPRGAMATATQMLLGGSMMLVLGLLRGERFAEMPSPRSLAAVAYLVVFGSLIAFSAYGYLLRHTRRLVATSYAYVNPVIAVALGVRLGGEKLPRLALPATAAVLAGVLVVSLARHRAVEARRDGR